MTLNSTSPKGYTLIELLVVMTIGIILFGVGLAGYREFSRRQDLTGVSKSITNDILLIKQYAMTGRKPSGSTCIKLIGYSFARSISGTNYKIYANCKNNENLVNIEIKSVDLADGISFTSSTNSFVFKVLGSGTDLQSDNTINIVNAYSGNTAKITIGVGGNIE